MRSATRILVATILTTILPGTPARAADTPSQEDLLTLSTLELLYEHLDERADLGLGDLIAQAAATLHFPRDQAGPVLAEKIARLQSAEQTEEDAARHRKIAAKAAKLSGVTPATLALFTDVLLASLGTALRTPEDIFLDELIGETAAAVQLDELSGHSLTMRLAYAAAQQLRSQPPSQIGAMPAGTYVLAVHFRPSARERSIRGFKLRPWDERARKNGTDYVTERLSRSMTIKRKFRRIIPCYNLVEAQNLLADYLLVLHAEEETWSLVQDTREKDRADPEDLLSKRKTRSRQQPSVYQLELELHEHIEGLASGKKVWQAHALLKYYMDDLSGRALSNASSFKNADWILPTSSPLLGILDAMAARFLKDFRKAK